MKYVKSMHIDHRNVHYQMRSKRNETFFTLTKTYKKRKLLQLQLASKLVNETRRLLTIIQFFF